MKVGVILDTDFGQTSVEKLLCGVGEIRVTSLPDFQGLGRRCVSGVCSQIVLFFFYTLVPFEI